MGGGDDDVLYMCIHVRCYGTVALAHMYHATQLMGWVGGWGGWG